MSGEKFIEVHPWKLNDGENYYIGEKKKPYRCLKHNKEDLAVSLAGGEKLRKLRDTYDGGLGPNEKTYIKVVPAKWEDLENKDEFFFGEDSVESTFYESRMEGRYMFVRQLKDKNGYFTPIIDGVVKGDEKLSPIFVRELNVK